MLQIAIVISYGLGLYLGVGFIFALWFALWGVRQEAIEGRAIVLRLMLMPGAILLWPILLRRKSTP